MQKIRIPQLQLWQYFDFLIEGGGGSGNIVMKVENDIVTVLEPHAKHFHFAQRGSCLQPHL